MAVQTAGPADQPAEQPTTAGSLLSGLVDAAVSGAVDPDFKLMMDEYESFMASYCDLLERQRDGSATLDDLQQVTTLLQQELDWLEKIDAVDYETLSAADTAYYLAVTLRVNERLLEVSGSM